MKCMKDILRAMENTISRGNKDLIRRITDKEKRKKREKRGPRDYG